jgi:hypothetical protein
MLQSVKTWNGLDWLWIGSNEEAILNTGIKLGFYKSKDFLD